MTTTTETLFGLTTTQLVEILRRDVNEWNTRVNATRRAHPGWVANLSGATLYGATLSRADLSGATLSRAYLSRANLSGANLSGATIDNHTLTSTHAPIGEAAGYTVHLFQTTTGHIIRAGCFTGTLDEAVSRALEEEDSERTRMEAEAVVAHGRALLAIWQDGAS